VARRGLTVGNPALDVDRVSSHAAQERPVLGRQPSLGAKREAPAKPMPPSSYY
jgi:hypothetical protein